MKQYLALGNDILDNGNQRGDRTGTGTISVFGRQVRYDLKDNVLPLLTTKKMFLRGLLEELFWLNAGDTNNNTLFDKNVHIWDEWAVKKENLEYSIKERCKLAMEQCPDSSWFGTFSRIVNEDGTVTAISAADITAALNDHCIPTLKPNPLGVKVGALGPIYGEQWRRWPSREMIAIPLTLQERLTAVDQLHQQFNFLAFPGRDEALRAIGERLTKGDIDEVMEEAFHKQLDGFNVPSARYEHATIDQIAKVIDDLKKRPNSRRIIVAAWNPSDMPDESVSPEQNVINGKAALASCHTLFQFYVEERDWNDVIDDITAGGDFEEYHDWWNATYDRLGDEGKGYVKTFVRRQWIEVREGIHGAARQWAKDKGYFVDKLSCQLYQRSADFALGVPFNVASYSLLTMMVAQCVGMAPGEFIHTFGDLHIYLNHIEKMEEQLKREPFALPTIAINPDVKDIFAFKIEDFKLEGYQSHDKIDYPIAK